LKVGCGTKIELHKRKLVQAAQGTQRWWSERPHAREVVADAKAPGAWVVVAEQTTASVHPEQLVPVFPATLVLGGERSGVSPEVIDAADTVVAIPMLSMAIRSTWRPPPRYCLYWLMMRFEGSASGFLDFARTEKVSNSREAK
jgi:SpoU rRNA Methylase family